MIRRRFYNRIRSYRVYGLILFIFVGFRGCTSSTENPEIRILWQGKAAAGVFIPSALTQRVPSDSVVSLLKVRLVNSDPSVSILGNHSVESEGISFAPLVPFTRGLQYVIVLRNAPIGTFAVPLADTADAPKLLGIYPSQDSLPENLLKVYLHFSQPMREGKSNEYAFLIKNDSDTVQGAFLNLQPELWNEDRTVLTLWLDPGRIKRDLHPNQLLGAPLKKNGRYRIKVSPAWKDQQGTPLPQPYTKSFVTIQRDSLSPVPGNWTLSPPPVGTTQPVKVDFKESLDHSLIAEGLSITNENGKLVSGKWEVGTEEKAAFFKPVENWKAGKYGLRVRTVLEDLAGNNVNRPFDRDISQSKIHEPNDALVVIWFVVKR